MDLKKYLPTEEMMKEFEEYSKLTDEKEKAEFHAHRSEKYLQKTPEEQELVKLKTLEGLRQCKIINDTFQFCRKT